MQYNDRVVYIDLQAICTRIMYVRVNDITIYCCLYSMHIETQ